MNQKILGLRPKRFLCPYCGRWHKYVLPFELGYYDSRSYKAEFLCENYCDINVITIFFSDGYCHYETGSNCPAMHFEIEDNIPIEDFVLSSTEPCVTIDIPFDVDEEVCANNRCSTCSFKHKLLDGDDSQDRNITFGFEFEQSDYDELFKSDILARKESELKEREKAVKSKEQSLLKRENAIKSKEQSLMKCESAQKPKEHAQQEIKEDATMKNNIFNLNLEFGPNKDENIASTLMGIAVKNEDNWRIYDKKKKEITDVGDIQLGNLPIFILPTTKLNEGDLIKDASEYYYVMKVEKESTQTLCAKTGEMKTIIPIKNVLGFSCYSKVSAFSDFINVGEDFDVEKLALMSTMCGQNGKNSGQMNQLVPLMLFKDKLGGDDDMMKIMLMTSMMSTSEEGGDQSATMNQLLPLMLFNDEFGGDDDMMKMMLMTSMMDGSKTGNNNPTMGYLMLDMLMGKKEEPKEAPKEAPKRAPKKAPKKAPNDDSDEKLNDDSKTDDSNEQLKTDDGTEK